jgi:NAD dependent epimerase/dehydratase family enzyme
MGTGKQWISWISINDLLGAAYHCLMKEELSGPVNFSAPSPLTQAEFVHILAKKLHRPAFCHIPAWALKAVFGTMATEMVLSSQKVKPEKLLKTGYTFLYPDLTTALDLDCKEFFF